MENVIGLLWLISPLIVVVLFVLLFVQSYKKSKLERVIRSNEAEIRSLNYRFEALKKSTNNEIAELRNKNMLQRQKMDKMQERVVSIIHEKEGEVTSLRHNIKQEQLLTKETENEIKNLKKKKEALERKLNKRNEAYRRILKSKEEALPYVASLAADYLTYDLEVWQKGLSWGEDKKRLKKAEDIRVLRSQSKEMIEKLKESEYKLRYAMEIYPEIEEILELEGVNIKEEQSDKLIQHEEIDRTKHYLSDSEWNSLSETERSQLALDRYVESHRKSNWQIGRDYELFVGRLYENKGWNVEYYGSSMKLQDMGRDLIARKGERTEIIQCKYWGKDKLIHEKHIFQLYGTTIMYKMTHSKEIIVPRFVTNNTLSDTAREVAQYLDINYQEELEMGQFPRIKCNIGRDEYGAVTKIYHLPMDQQYDNVIIEPDKGEFFAMTVLEAENAGFRRAYKWYG